MEKCVIAMGHNFFNIAAAILKKLWPIGMTHYCPDFSETGTDGKLVSRAFHRHRFHRNRISINKVVGKTEMMHTEKIRGM